MEAKAHEIFCDAIAGLPQDVRRHIFGFLRHPAAELICKLKFLPDHNPLFPTQILRVFGDDLPRFCGGARKLYFEHNSWSGEAVDCYDRLRRHKHGRIDCLPDGHLQRWGHTKHPPQVR